MITIPPNVNNSYGIKIQEVDYYYSNLNFIFQYVKEAIIPFLFVDGTDTFFEIISNYASAEMRKSVFEDTNNDPTLLLAKKGDTLCAINVEHALEMSNRASMNTLLFNGTMYDPAESPYFIFKDNNIVLSYVPNIYNYNVTFAIRSTQKMKLANLVGHIYNKVHLSKKFLLGNVIPIKYLADDTLIKIMKLFYSSTDTMSFSERLNIISNGEHYEELDTTTNITKNFFNIHSRPIITINSIDSGEDITIGMSLELMLPSLFLLNSTFSAQSILSGIIEKVTLNVPSTLSAEDKDNMVNFNYKFINANRSLFPFTDAEVKSIYDGTLIPYIDVSNLTPDEIQLIGDSNEEFSQIENIRLTTNSEITDTVLSAIQSSTPLTVVDGQNVTWNKIKTVAFNLLSSPDAQNVLNVGDDTFVNMYRTNNANIYFVIRVSNIVVTDYTITPAPDGTLNFTFNNIDVINKLITIALYSKV